MLITVINDTIAEMLQESPEHKFDEPIDSSADPRSNATPSSNRKGRRRAVKAIAPQADSSADCAQREPDTAPPTETKTALVLRLLRQDGGATLPEIAVATAWQAHSVRGFLSGTVRKKLGLNLISEAAGDGARRYRIDGGAAPTDTSAPIELPPFGPFKGAPKVEQSATDPET